MKTNAVVLIVSAGVGAALVGVGACSSIMANKNKKIVIEDARIFIPGNAITKEDQDSVSAILSKYKKSLYKVQTFQDGNPSSKAKGTLADEVIGAATVAQVKSDAKQNALSGWGIQIGSATSSHPTQPGPTPQPSGSPSHPTTVQPAVPNGSPSHPTTMAAASHPQRPRNEDEETSREMVAKIAPILRKYSE
jgi:hypothetical protein